MATSPSQIARAISAKNVPRKSLKKAIEPALTLLQKVGRHYSLEADCRKYRLASSIARDIRTVSYILNMVPKEELQPHLQIPRT